MFGLMLPIAMLWMILGGVLGIALFALWIWAIVDCLTGDMTAGQKLFWVMVVIILNFLGAFIYLLSSRAHGKNMAGSSRFRGKRLYRSKDRIIAGVCGGIGEYIDIDPTVVRLIWVVLTLMSLGTGIIAYAVAWIVMPEKKR